MSLPSDIAPLPRTRRGWVTLAVVAALAVISFALVTVGYSTEGGIRTTGGVGADAADGIIVVLTPEAVDASKGTVQVHLAFRSQGDSIADGEGRASQNLRVTVEGGSGATEYNFPAGSLLGQAEFALQVDGEVASYPFDEHVGGVWVSADAVTRAADGSVTSSVPVAVAFEANGGVNGWDTSIDLTDGMQKFGEASLAFHRAFSTQVFALLIIALAVVLGIFAMAVAVLVFTGQRPAEVALLGWSAALLFSLPLLRNYMPNAPPFGAAIDIYAYLWAIVMAVFAALLTVLAWVSQRKPVRDDRPPADHRMTGD